MRTPTHPDPGHSLTTPPLAPEIIQGQPGQRPGDRRDPQEGEELITCPLDDWDRKNEGASDVETRGRRAGAFSIKVG